MDFTNGYVLLDGAMGTNLYKRGLPAGVCVEEWNMAHPEVFLGVQNEYIEAGSDVIYAPTFSANRVSLSNYGLGDKVYLYNRALTELSVKNAAQRCAVAASVTTTGLFVKPFGDTSFDELIQIYVEQINGIKDGGAEFVVGETLMNITDIRAFAYAAKECNMPFAVTVTVDGSYRTLSGLTVAAAVLTAQDVGAMAVGINCSEGPELVASALQDAVKYARIPLIAKPNGGLPDAPVSVDDFITAAKRLLELGVTVIGGCCGTDKEYIKALRRLLDSQKAFALPRTALYACADWQNVFDLPKEPVLSETYQINTPDELYAIDATDCDVVCIGVNKDNAADVAAEAFCLSKPIRFVGDCDAVGTAVKYYQGVSFKR